MSESRCEVMITESEAKKMKEQGEIFFSPSQFAEKLDTTEKALRQMRWRAKKGKGINYYPYYKLGNRILYPYSLFLKEAEKYKNV